MKPVLKTHMRFKNLEFPLCGSVGISFTFSNNWEHVDCGSCQRKRAVKPVPQRNRRVGARFNYVEVG